MTWKVNPSHRRQGWLVVIGPRHTPFDAAIMSRIPADQRTWDLGLRAWLVHEDARETLESIIADACVTYRQVITDAERLFDYIIRNRLS